MVTEEAFRRSAPKAVESMPKENESAIGGKIEIGPVSTAAAGMRGPTSAVALATVIPTAILRGWAEVNENLCPCRREPTPQMTADTIKSRTPAE